MLRTDKDQQFLIHRQACTATKETVRRLEQLKAASRSGVLLVSDVVVHQLGSGFSVFVVEPVRHSVEKLTSVLSGDRPTKVQKTVLYRNLLSVIVDLHALAIPHLEICPEAVFVENKSVVTLRAFHVVPLATREAAWYQAPEQLFGHKTLGAQLQCDLWALGCVFSDFFLSLTPVFQSVEDEDRLHKLFEVMGLPAYCDVREYVSEEVYSNLRSIECEPEVARLISALTPEEGDYMLSMLSFDPRSRPPASFLLSNFPAVEDRLTPERLPPAFLSKELATGPYEFYERSGTASLMSSRFAASNPRFNFPLQSQTSPFATDFSMEVREKPKVLEDIDSTPVREAARTTVPKLSKGVGTSEIREPRVVEDVKIPDNQLVVNVFVGKNLL